MPHWVATAAPPRRPVFAPAAAVPRRRRLFAPARRRGAPLGRRSVPPVALSQPAASKHGERGDVWLGLEGHYLWLEKSVPHPELGGTLGLATINAIADASVVEAHLVAGAPHA
eukprot:scaffold95772_cov66-Phaeocystis_antarctica.AAC.3